MADDAGAENGDGAAAADDTADAATAGATAEQARLLQDVLHYVLVANIELAEASAEQLLASEIADQDLALLVQEQNLAERLERALARSRKMGDGISKSMSSLEAKVENGRRSLARSGRMIQSAVDNLVGSGRQQVYARARLMSAGEFAVPALLRASIGIGNDQLALAAQRMLVQLGSAAVAPLVAALPDLDGSNQVLVCEILGTIGSPTAAAGLRALELEQDGSQEVSSAAGRAYTACGGKGASVSAEYTSLARAHFDRRSALLAQPYEPNNFAWTWEGDGLMPIAVPTEAFHAVMGMQAARAALQADSSNAQALALFVANDLRREAIMGESPDPVGGDRAYSAAFFATAAGATIGQDVLALALGADDLGLARTALAHLGEIAGEQRLAPSDVSAACDALTYGDRRVRFDAALLFGGLAPTTSFAYDSSVVPTLASILAVGADPLAAVIATSSEDRAALQQKLSATGFRVVGGDFRTFEELEAALGSTAVDLLVVQVMAPELPGRRQTGDAGNLTDISGTARAVAGLRASRTMASVPALVSVGAAESSRARAAVGADRNTELFEIGAPDEAFNAAVTSIMGSVAGGAMTSEDASGYATQALSALRAIASKPGCVLDAGGAEPQLLDALARFEGELRLDVASTVAMLTSARAQCALGDAALAASGDEQTALLRILASSARRNGNRLQSRHVDGLRDLIGSSSGDTAVAAGQAWGALDLPVAESVGLIVK
ncbi:MAG: hypothetical protein FJ254_08060 [Phycisphaerae bacterium]|nr:hypothetical protein [Phycisphaerae bacterium]